MSVQLLREAVVELRQWTLQLVTMILKVFVNGFKRVTQLITQDLFTDTVVELPLLGPITSWHIIQFTLLYWVLRGRGGAEIILLGIIWFYIL